METSETVESLYKSTNPPEYYRHEKDPLDIREFVKGVDWTEPWLIGLITFHLLITTLNFSTRHHGNFQAVFFVILLFLVYVSSNLNEIAARNYMYFSRQQYFDSNGMFISIMFSSPLLLNCLVMVGHWLWTSGNLMVKLKREQLLQELRASRQRQRAQSANDHQKED